MGQIAMVSRGGKRFAPREPRRNLFIRLSNSRAPSRQWLALASVLGVAIVAFSLILGSQFRADPKLSVFDETAHYDYAIDLRDGTSPVWGERYQQSTLRVVDCDDAIGPVASRCAVKHRDPRAVAPDGYSYEAQQPPLAYVPYALLARPNAAPATAIQAARRGGEVWTIIAGILLLLLAAIEDLSLLQTSGLLAFCLLCPEFVYAAATVTNDSSSVAAGALIMITASASRRYGKSLIALGLMVGLVVGLLKGLYIVVPAVLVLASVITSRPRWRDRDSWWAALRRAQCEIAMAVGTLVAYVAWLEIQAEREEVPSSVVLHALLGFAYTRRIRWNTIFLGVQDLFQMWSGYFGAPLYALWDYCAVAVLIGAILLRDRVKGNEEVRARAISSVVGLCSLALAWPIVSFFQGHADFNAPGRYGLPLLPILALVIVRSLRRVGSVNVGLLLPAAAGATQLLTGKTL
jgi:hypothetical protein